MAEKPKDKKKIIKETTNTTVDTNTGEVVEIKNKKEYLVKREPDYIKLYLEDITQLNGLTNSDVLFFLARKMNYDGEVVLISDIVDNICKTIGLSKNHFYKIIKGYCDKNILFKKARSFYVFNPYIFARGSWDDIRNIRMTIDYDFSGRNITTEVNVKEIDDKVKEEIKKEVVQDFITQKD